MIQDRDIVESLSFDGLELETPPLPFGPALNPEHLLQFMASFFDRWQGAHPRVAPMVGASAPQRCSDHMLSLLAKLATERNAHFHTHVLETKSQIVATRHRYGRSVVAVLDELGLLNSRSSFAHCVWMDSHEFAAVRDAGAVVVHNPISNLRCGSGLLPLADLLTNGVTVGLGADGAASNDNQNMFEAMKFASLVHTLYGDHRHWPQPLDIFKAGLQGGAAALGVNAGRIEPGYVADLMLLNLDRHVVSETDTMVASLVLAEHGESVSTVIVDGAVAVRDRVPEGYDRKDLSRRAKALQIRIHEQRPDRQLIFDRWSNTLTAIHLRDEAMAVPVQRLAAITSAFSPDHLRRN
jgi:cytosine/adenosine deaminase-related metal-dependent hydrolase